MSKVKPATEVAHSARLMLRHLDLSDAARIQPLADDWEVAKQTANLPFPYGEGEAHNFVEMALQAKADGKEYVYAIIRRNDAALLGLIGLVIDLPVIETGYWLGQAYWGQGFASEALGVVQNYAREALFARKLAAIVFEDNLASIRVLTKCGFQYQESWIETIPSRGGVRRVCRYSWTAG